MHTRVLVAAGLALSLAAGVASAQTTVDRSFTTTSKDCSGVNWSPTARTLYPNIATACQGVEERNGKTYVKFEGKVEKNINRGQQLAIKFKDGGTLTLAPPANTALYVNGKKTPVRDLQRGDELNFYVPQDQLVAHFVEEEITAPLVRVVEEEETQVAQNLPETATQTTWFAFAGAILLAMGAGLTLRRRRRHH
jgi:LPXTG-motif cell wall-anchored protein